MDEEYTIFAAFLRSRGMTYTAVRQEILRVIIDYRGDFGVRDILPLIKVRGVVVNRASLYRNIRLLKRAGIIEEVPLAESVLRGTYRLSRRATRQYLLFCPGCHSAEAFEDDALDVALKQLCDRFSLNFDTLQVKIEGRHLCGHHHDAE